MHPTNGKTLYDEFAIYHAAQAARAQAFGGAFAAIGAGIKGLVNRLIVKPIKARVHKNRQLDELMNMDDHMLRDLGLSRGGIAYAFEHGREADPAPANTNAPARKKPAAA